MTKTIEYFIDQIEKTTNREEAKEVIMSIILAAAHDNDLVTSAFDYINEQFMLNSLNKDASNQSELN